MINTITIIGSTASGKSDLAVNIALYLKSKYNKDAEIISTDSRQIYKYLNLSSGKITKDEMKGIKHHMLDIVQPDMDFFSVNDFEKIAKPIIQKIHNENKIAILCGGTGLYIDALLYNQKGAITPPNQMFREEYEKFELNHLQKIINDIAINKKINIDNVDINNKRRIIRALEIINDLGYIPKIENEHKKSLYNNIFIKIDIDKENLRNRIMKRIEKRIDEGMIEEIENLIKNNTISIEKLNKLGLEFKHISKYLQSNKNSKDLNEFKEKLFFDIWHYAKRQKLWFKKYNNDINIKFNDLDNIYLKIDKYFN